MEPITILRGINMFGGLKYTKLEVKPTSMRNSNIHSMLREKNTLNNKE